MSETNAKKVREPLFHIEKRANMSAKKAWTIRLCSVLAALLLCSILATILIDVNPFEFFAYIFEGAVGTENRIWRLLRETALLLGVAIALAPAFRMKFWNLGANGQVLVGCLSTTACMFLLGGKVPNGVLFILMFFSSVVSGAIWAALPAVCKALWKTNESLFTLMMNYIAEGLVAYFLSVWVKSGSGTLDPMTEYQLPKIINADVLPIIVAALLTAGMFVYMKYSKHGYEISVVGESENTARYVGINVKKVVIRTLILSGAICGVMGFLISGALDGTVSETSAANRGFTAIMVVWLGKINPGIMAAMAFFVCFLNRGVSQARTRFHLTNDAFCDIVSAIVFFFLIGSEFFISYALKSGERWKKFTAKIKGIFKKKKVEKVAEVAGETAGEAAEKDEAAEETKEGE